MTAKEYLNLIDTKHTINTEIIVRTNYLPYSYKHQMVTMFLDKFITYKNNVVKYDSALLYRAFKQVVLETYFDLSLSDRDADNFDGYDLLDIAGVLDLLIEEISDEYRECLEILELKLKDLYREKMSLEAIININLDNLIQMIDDVLNKLVSTNLNGIKDININEVIQAYQTLNKSINTNIE